MYRPTPSNRDRALTITAVVLIHLGLGYAFLNVSNTLRTVDPQEDLQIFDVTVPPPPPPPVVEKLPEPEKAKPKKDEGAASAKNIKSQATPVVAPKPRVVVPAKSPLVATKTPNTGAAPTQGASNVVGPGTGAGGSGTGTGSGGSGSGSGGGGDGPEGRPALISRKLTERDYPNSLRQVWPSGGRVLVIFSVQIDGRATGCTVHTSSGVPAIDQVTCSLVESKLRFRPAYNRRGEPYVEKYAYAQAPVNF